MRLRDLISSAALGLLVAGPFAMPTARPALAQDQADGRATLVSDRLEITGDNRLIASGNVEIFHKGSRLKASRITYDQANDRLLIEGPLVLTEPNSGAVVLAGQADLAADMSEGILTSARVVMNQQLQLAAAKMTRMSGRYTTLDQVVASSCQVCAANPVPLWEIRAARVTHDQEERQIYFDHAQFRVAGMPIAWIPRLRMPDPTLDRATGFLNPRLRTTSDLGPGIKIPYFIALGPSRDLTLTPYIAARNSQTLELRYRQAFRTGEIELNGAITRDKLLPGDLRGYVFATGSFDMPQDFTLKFDLKTTSDNAYLLDYGYSSLDRLDSRVELERVRRNGYFATRVISFQSLRDDESNSTLPSLLLDSTFHRRFSLGPLGGEGGFRLQTHNHYRSSNDPLDTNLDGIADGRDMGRISARVDWRRSFFLPAGIEATALGEAQADAYRIRDDDIYGGDYGRGHMAAGMELRWPWLKTTDAGVTHVITPIAQLVWGGRHGDRVPNEDSVLVEFDEGNLFSLDRFPGADAVEEGRRLTLGLGWTRYDPQGWSMGVAVGRVFRDEDFGQFGPASGLGGKRSDWLVAATIDWQNNITGTGRLVFNDDFNVAKGEVRLDMNHDDLALGASALWAVADPSENRPNDTRELVFDGSWQATPALAATFKGSYDFMSDRGTLAGLGLIYRNECVSVDLSLSRRFTSSTSVTPTTDFGLSVDLLGFGGGKTAGPARRCY